MKPDVKSKLEIILGYPFFDAVGKPLPEFVTPVNGWRTAAKICRSSKWEACQLMARNALSRHVCNRSWERVQEWNPLAEEISSVIGMFIDTLQDKVPISVREFQNVRDAVSWDIMAICFEHECRDLIEPFFYIPVVEHWYAVGHFPCGWDGDEFPDDWDGGERFGQLMVF